MFLSAISLEPSLLLYIFKCNDTPLHSKNDSEQMLEENCMASLVF